ncbi:MAG: DUF5522 domain-containing protein [Candidatus Polarisedimenticolia bacterium]
MPSFAPLPPDRVVPHPDRLPPGTPGYDHILKAHEKAMAAAQAAYVDPLTGLMVMTARYLWDRGSCCDSGCRHCPWLSRT